MAVGNLSQRWNELIRELVRRRGDTITLQPAVEAGFIVEEYLRVFRLDDDARRVLWKLVLALHVQVVKALS